jgi:sugar phosphate permease
MTAESRSYNPLVIKAWAALCAIVCLILLGMLVFGPQLIEVGRAVWDLLRWLATPII